MPNLIKKLTNEIDRLLGGEIKELKFGCRVITDKGENVTILGKGEGWLTYLDKDNLISHEEASGKPVEILGRPINLEDVMRAIIKKIPYNYYSEEDGRGIISAEYGDIIDMWNWGKPLSSQSLETVEKIAEILK